jgi:hypothetical protein
MPTMKPTASVSLRALGCALALALTAGCTAPSNLPHLKAMPDYEDAMRCAPNFTTEALNTIADLEALRK